MSWFKIQVISIFYFSLVIILLHHTVNARNFIENPILSANNSSKESVEALHVKDNKSFKVLESCYWRTSAQLELQKKLARNLNKNKARNVILFMGDGMSIATLTVTRSYLGRITGTDGEATKLSFEKFSHTGLSKTYCLDRQVADSACSATAYLCGVKANVGTLGVNGGAKRKDCAAQAQKSNHLTSLAQWAQDAGKATGLITTTRVTHASPAGLYARSVEREWESDANVLAAKQDPNLCPDITSQLVNHKPGIGLKVILGGGRKNFLSEDDIDDEGERGVRKDGKNLIKKWLDVKNKYSDRAKYIHNRKQLLDIDPKQVDDLLGLFGSNHMKFHLDADHEVEPTLEEMTIKGIEVLQKSSKGYFLFVEGGLIDKAHHRTWARKALDETVEFSKAVEAAIRMTDPADTLIVVTSDHAHTMSYGGYASREEDVLGLAPLNGTDGVPYTILSYANGPGYKPNDDSNRRHNVLSDDISNVNYTFPSLVPIQDETHGGDDVAVFAQGPWSHLFSGNYEQNLIPHMISYAACIGSGATLCDP